MMTKIKAAAGLILTLALLVVAVSAGSEGRVELFPFPVVETERVIGRWLRDSGHDVLQDDSVSGEIRLRAHRLNEEWEIVLRPSSPLKTVVFARSTVGGIQDQTRLEKLWSMLDRYTKGIPLDAAEADLGVPKEVLQHAEAVVCMESDDGPGHIQLSGFAVEDSGLILTTAHDLKESMLLTVISKDGLEFKGRVIKVDPLLDLALIQARFKPLAPVSLAKSRLTLNLGEKIYSIGCPRGSPGAVYSGTVNSPPRLADALPLWQVGLRVLPGSSGSPVFDARGNLVGVIKGRYRGTDSIGFLIPLSIVMELLGR
jgi:serine protease Do